MSNSWDGFSSDDFPLFDEFLGHSLLIRAVPDIFSPEESVSSGESGCRVNARYHPLLLFSTQKQKEI
jgi:hypothetical protein